MHTKAVLISSPPMPHPPPPGLSLWTAPAWGGWGDINIHIDNNINIDINIILNKE